MKCSDRQDALHELFCFDFIGEISLTPLLIALNTVFFEVRNMGNSAYWFLKGSLDSLWTDGKNEHGPGIEPGAFYLTWADALPSEPTERYEGRTE